MAAKAMSVGVDLDAVVCDAVGIAPELFYDATRDGESYMDAWTRREPAEDWVAHMKKRFPGQYEDLTVKERKSYPRVSEWIQDAFLVVDVLEKAGWWIELTRRSYSTGTEYVEGGWSCDFRQVKPVGEGSVYVEAPTRELAICLAALEVANKGTPIVTREVGR